MTNSLGKRMFLSKLRDIGVVKPIENLKQDTIVESVNRFGIKDRAKCTVQISGAVDFQDASIFSFSESAVAETGDLQRMTYFTKMEIAVPLVYQNDLNKVLDRGSSVEITIHLLNPVRIKQSPEDAKIYKERRIYTFVFVGDILEAKKKYNKLRISVESKVNGFKPRDYNL